MGLPDGSVATGAQDNVVRLFAAPGSPGAGADPALLIGHERLRGVDGVTALAAVAGETGSSVGVDTGLLLSAGKDGVDRYCPAPLLFAVLSVLAVFVSRALLIVVLMIRENHRLVNCFS